MSERRMFAKTIIDSDAFLDMPLSSQALYFHLSMRADDEGFINNPKKIQRMIGASDDDMKVLLAKNFIIALESGVIVIKHWKIHNYIRGDRLVKTVYADERAMLELKENGAYTLAGNIMPSHVSQVSVTCQSSDSIGKDSIGKDSIGKDRIGKKKGFTKPCVEEVKAYCQERNNGIDANSFVDYYESKGWLIGKNHMKDWKAAVRTWENRRKGEANGNVGRVPRADEEQRNKELDEYIKRQQAGEFDDEDAELRRIWDE